MEQNPKELIQKRFEELPKALQDAVTSNEVEKKLRELTEKHKLHIDQGVRLENETMLVMMGLEDASEYEKNITHELEISPELAREITAEVAKDIFLPIRESLRELLEKDRENEESEESNEEGEVTPEAVEGPPAPLQAGAARRLTQAVESSPVNIAVDTKTGEKKYKADPYREPVE